MNGYPQVIQGGMGAGISNWRLANAVARHGQLGVVSGTAIDAILVRRLQDGDPGGDMRRALGQFPVPAMAQRIIDRYFVAGGLGATQPYRAKPIPTIAPHRALLELIVVANFAEVFLAKEGHDGPVGINLLEKIQLPNLASLYGAMLAGVDYVLMGAGIPIEIPGALDRLANHESARLKLHVTGATPGDEFISGFDPQRLLPLSLPPLRRPAFLAIIASATLALTLARKASGHVDGFIVEGPTAGGHNAPPRGALQLNERGEPIYGPRDEVDLAKIAALGRPFWLAGAYGTPERLQEALALGATGIQVGTAFAFCDESGLDEDLKQRVLARVCQGETEVFTDPLASPTGFPFKIVRLPGTASEESAYAARGRICDLGYLRELYKREDGTVGYRCPAEPIDDYVSKGGDPAETTGRKCLCNGLVANLGQAQRRPGGAIEPPLLTAGDDLTSLVRLLPPGDTGYGAADVLRYLLEPAVATC